MKKQHMAGLFLLTLLLSHARAATWTVTSSADDNGPNTFTLRDVINNRAHANDTINFAAGLSGSTITLTLGELALNYNVTITGLGANKLTVSGNSSSRIFNIGGGANVQISGLTIVNGKTTGDPARGGAILNSGALQLTACVLNGNMAKGSDNNSGGTGAQAQGGAIWNENQLSLNACTLSSNQARGGAGNDGGIGEGGGLYTGGSGTLALTNCTLVGNLAVGGTSIGSGAGGMAGGGALSMRGDSGVLVNCTVNLNLAVFGYPYDLSAAIGIFGYGAFGGGLLANSFGPFSVLNSIVDGNFSTVNGSPNPDFVLVVLGDGYDDTSGSFTSLGHNLIGFQLISGWFPADGDQVQVWPDVVALGDLTDNGGPTPTMAIGKASAAYDAGSDAVLNSPYNLTTDQRGQSRPSDAHVDIGAYELQSATVYGTNYISDNSWSPTLAGWHYWVWPTFPDPPPPWAYTVFLTNITSKIISITSTDSTTYSNSLIISNLVIGAPFGASNSLVLSNSGFVTPLRIHENLFVMPRGSLIASNSAIELNSGRTPSNHVSNGTAAIFDGPVSFVSASFNASNVFNTAVGKSAPAILGVTNSNFRAYNLMVASGSDGTANFMNSTSSLGGALYVATTAAETGKVSIVGGRFTGGSALSSNDFSLILDQGDAQMTVSNATAQFGNTIIGSLGKGWLTVSSGTLSLGKTYLGRDTNSSGASEGWLNIFGGQTSASELHVGGKGSGYVSVTGGTLSNEVVTLADKPGSYGNLLIAGGTHKINSMLTVASGSNSTGIVTITGGALRCLNGSAVIGSAGDAQLLMYGGTLSVSNGILGIGNAGSLTNGTGTGYATISNATLVAASIQLGSTRGGDGDMTIDNLGAVTALGGFSVNDLLVKSGGSLNVLYRGTPFTFEDATLHNRIVGGYQRDGAINVTGGTVAAPEMVLGITSGKTGSLTMTAGSVSLTNLTLGDCSNGAVGNVTMNGGTLFATNLVIANGAFLINTGTVIADSLIITNSCAQFRHNGGTLIFNHLILDPNQDADGDGVSNGAEQLAGTDPLNFASFLFTPGRFGIVNMIPSDSSGETDHNTEPSLGVGTGANFGKFVAHTFGNDFLHNPLFTSTGDFLTWTVGHTSSDGDATLDWTSAGNAYLATLGFDGSIFVNASGDPAGTGFSPMAAAGLSGALDQPWIKAASINGVDHIYVGFNNLLAARAQTAAVRFSVDSGANWQTKTIEKESPGIQDSPAIRLAISGDGSHVYALFQRWQSRTLDSDELDMIGDVVLTRDDNSGLNSFGALPGAAFPNLSTAGHGTVVESGVTLPWSGVQRPFSGTSLGAQRLGAGCDVAVHPNDPKKVYVAYTVVGLDQYQELFTGPKIRIMSSSDGGNTFGLEREIGSASLPCLAVAGDGTVGLLYGEYRSVNLEIHFLKAYVGDFSNYEDRILARFPDNNPKNPSRVYVGDYFQLKAVGNNFYGIFSASGEPDSDHFPNQAYYQRYVKIGSDLQHNAPLLSSGDLVTAAGSRVNYSIDPFFFYDIAPSWWRSPRLSLLTPSSNQAGDPLGGSYRIVWPIVPSNNPPIQLQASAALGAGANWTAVTNVIRTNGLNEAAISISQPMRFFRLCQNVAGGQFQVIASSGANGSISPRGVLSMSGLSSQTFTAMPSNNYSIATWYLDGAVVSSNASTFTVSNITSDHSVVATFAPPYDLAVSVFSANAGEGPPILTNDLVYQVRVANVGLSPVTGVMMTNALPPGVTFVVATNTQGTVAHSGSLVTANLGTLNAGAAATIWITAIPGATGSITDLVSVACNQFEPNLANNTATDVRTVVLPITITSQPQSQSVASGQTATFSVTASGTPTVPLNYRWIFNHTNMVVGGTNATLTLTGVTPAQAGTYSVNVYQVFGPENVVDEDSQDATLTVN